MLRKYKVTHYFLLSNFIMIKLFVVLNSTQQITREFDVVITLINIKLYTLNKNVVNFARK